MTVAMNVVYSLLVKNIDNWGHLGGALGGAATAWLLGPRLVWQQQQPLGDGSGSGGEGKGAATMTLGRFVDRPPVRWLAYPEGMFGAGGGSSSSDGSRVNRGGSGSGSAGAGVSSSGSPRGPDTSSSSGRGRKRAPRGGTGASRASRGGGDGSGGGVRGLRGVAGLPGRGRGDEGAGGEGGESHRAGGEVASGGRPQREERRRTHGEGSGGPVGSCGLENRSSGGGRRSLRVDGRSQGRRPLSPPGSPNPPAKTA